MIKEYLKVKKNEIIITASIFILIYILMILRDELFSNFSYALLLFVFFYMIYFIIGYGRFVSRYRSIKNINENNIDSIVPKNIIEEEYLSKIEKLMEKNYKQNAIRTEELDRLQEDYSIWIHQAKTPIAALSLIIESTDSDLKDDMKQELFKINQYTDMALANIRLQDINTDLEIKQHNLYELIKAAIKKYALYFNYKGNKLEFENFDKIIVTDEKWFVFALDQIISNAVKYTKNGIIKIYISDDNLVVEDNGIGIKEEDIPRLFSRGFTGFTGRVNKKATGLGLYMSKKILNTLGSNIYLESKIGEGTKVYIKITEN